MKNINFYKNSIYLNFEADDDGAVSFVNIGTDKNQNQNKANRFFVPAEVHITGENPDDHHGAKHTGGIENSLKYVSHTETDREAVLVLKNDKIQVCQHYEFINESKTVRSYCEVENISSEAVGLEYVSSFCMYGFEFENIWLCHNAWCRELDWRRYTPCDLGYSRINEFSTKRISVSNTGSWSTKEYMPMGILENQNGCIFWQIENNGSWNFEISDIQEVNYLKLSGPSEQENGWWKKLNPGEVFKTPAAAVAFSTDFNGVIEEMTKYRKGIGYQSSGDAGMPVIFNDYMKCLNADPTTEKEIPVIDAAAEIGADIYCMDAGWYADGVWWDTVGEWKVCESRFNGGLKKVFDYIRQKGMRPGIWLEPEVIGINCPILDRFSDECFFIRHGKRVIDHGRYQFDFRCSQVTDYLDGVVDRLIEEFGIEYFKFDYNIDGSLGTEVSSDSFGDGLMGHQQAYLNWIDGIYKRHPGLIIENCGSGGMRMDYRTLEHFSIQSTSDATDYKPTAPIAAMAGTALLPRQAQVWVLPMQDNSLDEIAFNAVNAMFKRPAVSGETHLLSDKQKEVLKEGVDFYKSIRDEIPDMIPFYPIGAVNFESPWFVSGYKGGKYDYICAARSDKEDSDTISISAKGYKSAECVYPVKSVTLGKVDLSNECLNITLPQNSASVIRLEK